MKNIADWTGSTIPDAYLKAQEMTSWRQLGHVIVQRQCDGGA